MSGVINYDFDPYQEVYVITECNQQPYVIAGTVLRVRASVLISGTTVVYDVRLSGNVGTSEFDAADVFVDKATAVAEYETRVS